jgi:predicted DNA-binding transcriptional regulator AlpA
MDEPITVAYPVPTLTEPLWTAADVARFFRVSQRSVWRMVRSGLLPRPMRMNRKLVRFEPDAVRAAYRRWM